MKPPSSLGRPLRWRPSISGKATAAPASSRRRPGARMIPSGPSEARLWPSNSTPRTARSSATALLGTDPKKTRGPPRRHDDEAKIIATQLLGASAGHEGQLVDRKRPADPGGTMKASRFDGWRRARAMSASISSSSPTTRRVAACSKGPIVRVPTHTTRYSKLSVAPSLSATGVRAPRPRQRRRERSDRRAR